MAVWNKRFCVLCGSRMFIFATSHPKGKPTLVLDLRGGTIEENKSKKYLFCLKVATSRSILLLAFQTRLDQSTWLERAGKVQIFLSWNVWIWIPFYIPVADYFQAPSGSKSGWIQFGEDSEVLLPQLQHRCIKPGPQLYDSESRLTYCYSGLKGLILNLHTLFLKLQNSLS